MQRVEDQPAFVLQARPWRETSLLLEVVTRDHGRVGLLARGVRGARSQGLRAALQPLQPLLLAWVGQGDLPRLVRGEPAGASLAPQGDALLGALYVNELLLRLLPRGEVHPAVFFRYLETIGALQGGEDAAWTLRRFERDLLADLGYALSLVQDAAGGAIEAGGHYRYDAESGAHRLAGPGNGSIEGACLLAFGQDTHPGAAQLPALRRLMRQVLRTQLGGRELRSWQLLADLRKHRGPRSPDA